MSGIIRVNRILMIALFSASAHAALAQPTNEPTRSLSLQRCIQLALEHNFEVKIERKGVEIARERLSLAYGGYDPVLRAGVNRAKDLSPGGFDPVPVAGTETERDSVSSALTGLLPTGLEYEVGGNAVDAHGSGPNGVFEGTSGSVGIQLRQPLLKNLWIDGTRLNIQISRKELKISELAWRGQVMDIVTRVELAFYDLLLARENVLVQEQALQLARELLEANKERIRLGVLATLDEKQAESQVSAQRALVLSANRTVNIQENILKGLLSDNLAEWQDVTIRPAGELAAVPQQTRRAESWNRGLAMRPDLLQARADLERLGYIVSYNRNQLFPQLDAVGSYGHSASDTEFSGAFAQVREGSSPFHSYGLQLTVPLARRTARSNYQISKAERSQSDLRLKQLEQDILLQIDDAIKAMETSFERVATTREARQFAEAALQGEQTKMENGKSMSFFVLQLQRDLTTARSEEVRALAEYNRAQAQLALREGSVLLRHQLEIDVKP